MYKYFWEDLGGYLWNEDSFESIFKLVLRREISDVIPILFNSQTTHSIFFAMSYHYRFSFIEHLLQLRHDIIDEITSVFNTQSDNNETVIDQGEVEEFIFERKAVIGALFEKVYTALSEKPYSIHFYLSFSKELIRGGALYEGNGVEMEILKKTLKNVRDEDIEIFLHYNPEVAVQIVEDLIDAPSKAMSNQINGGAKDRFGSNQGAKPNASTSLNNAIDKETKSLAQRIKKCPHYKSYKAFYTMVGNSLAGKSLVF